MERLSTVLVEWGMASRPLDPGQESGDAYLVRLLPQGALVAVVDGLGHGPDAAVAARAAIALLAGAEREHPMAAVRRCHEGLASTRGVVLSLARFDGPTDTLTWLGVGNVEGVLVRADRSASPAQESLLQRGGVVGHQLPALRADVLSIAPGDTLVFATDGIRADFARGLPAGASVQAAADRTLAEQRTGGDDALVVVVRYRGGEA